MNNHKNKNQNNDEKYLKKGFEAGVTMACLSMGKFEADEDNPKLKKFIEQLWSEFVKIVKHTKNNGGSDAKEN